ncbi:3-keto-disaccharide hydrolase [Sphingobacterium spiritivorum]|uniref:Domain of Uncharacterized Function (DUF1080) n=1 Tax=Sphingobacterium spiritivorum TaxID=258 RepID=A0A380B9I9_SPHSI|nr:DUF1080 domain-containing protein [Sphingobacterium spiritivorum]SUI97764.1 Domain of Uncharacterised Function (DUF1080) [Sphingobacterium spiritivorum]
MYFINKHLLFITLLFIVFQSCSNSNSTSKSLTDAEQKAGWQFLFNGENTEGWHIFNSAAKDSKWIVNNGVLACSPHKKDGIFGDLTTDKSYKNFELAFDWSIAKGGNSGVFINVQEDPKYSATFATGVEMQLLDNANAEPRHQKDSTHWAGCIYDVSCIGNQSKPKPFGEWNSSRIVQKDGKVSFYLNGVLTAEEDLSGPAWKAKVQQSNLKVHPDFAKATEGKIAFQNHTDSVAFRNIKIREI